MQLRFENKRSQKFFTCQLQSKLNFNVNTKIKVKELQLHMVNGDLIGPQQDLKSPLEAVKALGSLEEAIMFITKLAVTKTQEGYRLVREKTPVEETSETNADDMMALDEACVEKEDFLLEDEKLYKKIKLSPGSYSLKDALEHQIESDDMQVFKKSNEFKTFRNDVSTQISLGDFLSKLPEGLSEVMEIAMDKKIEKETQEAEMGFLLVEKRFKLPKLTKNQLKDIQERAERLDLISEILHDQIQVVGLEANILKFLTWLYELVSTNKPRETILAKSIMELDGQELAQEEIAISTFHRTHEAEILKKAQEMDIFCDVGYNMVLAAGIPINLNEFRLYLQTLETFAKRRLYPKYWDFYDTNIFSQVEAAHDSAEFKEISSLFKESLSDAELIKISRIQNHYLMNHYITNISMRQELRTDIVKRQLLFHSTSKVDPKEIYKNFDTGFDLQFAKTRGSYGSGIYFATQASFSHNSYAHFCEESGNYQMLLADVLVGNPYSSKPDRSLVKAPKGYDSIKADRDFYVIYNNFHSYPLYLIEYKVTRNNNRLSNRISFGNLYQPFYAKPGPASNMFGIGREMQRPTSQINLNSMFIISNKGSNILPNISENVNKTPPQTQPLSINNNSSRIYAEIRPLLSDKSISEFFIKIPNESDVTNCVVSFIGPKGTPYEGGTFQVDINIPSTYPFTAPSVRFKTKIYHPCIDESGKVCLGLLTYWQPSTYIRQVLLNICALLNDPEIEEALMPEIELIYKKNKQQFKATAIFCTQKYAK